LGSALIPVSGQDQQQGSQLQLPAGSGLRPADLAWLALAALAYYCAARLSLAIAIPPGYATAVWPPSGIAVASTLLLGNRALPGLWLGAFLANMGVEASALSAAIIATGNSLEALIGAALIRRFVGERGTLERPEHVFRFIALAAVSASVAATAGVGSVALGHDLAPWTALRNWWTWWEGDFTGIIVVAPLILSWSATGGAPWSAQKRLEAGAFFSLLVLAAAVLSSEAASSFVPFSLTFVALPFIIWAAFRFGLREVTTAIATACGVALWYAVDQRQAFASLPLNELLLMLLTFIGMVVATGLTLATVVDEQRRAAEALRRKGVVLETELKQHAYYDSLTGLPNRALFRERLVRLLDSVVAHGRKAAVAVVDIERFKTINDTFGRHGADELLKQVAARISANVAANVGGNILLAHAGGDRFSLAAQGFDSESAAALAVDQALVRWFSEPYALRGTQLRLSARAGLALAPDDGRDPDVLLLHAESALKNAKSCGDRYLFYRHSMSERVADRLSLENQLRAAIARREFVLHYQPQVDVDTRRVAALEALVRWRSPERGLVMPMEFIPLLEETGMILEVGRWALRQALEDQRLWAAQGLEVPRVAVNVSAMQLRQRDFVDSVREALDGRYGVDIEITESRIMEQIDANIEKLRQLRSLGVRIAIDDFGTGYSSLAYLARLPVHTLKIDRGFIHRMLKDDETMAVVQTIIALAQSLNLATVAEGVESEAQADILALLRCEQMQGHLIGRARPPGELTELLKRGHA
jgi:diguanylate cyclase (GGDEF)-like protein